MKIFLSIVLVLILNACSLKQSQVDKTQNFILKSDNEAFGKSFKQRDKGLKILVPDTPLYLNSYRVIYIENGLSSAYAHHFWGDLPSNLYRFMLLSKLEQSGIFETLVGQNSPITADLVLEGRLNSFEQIINERENYVKLSLSLNLIDVKKNRVLAHRDFVWTENIDKADVILTLRAFEKALNRLTSEIVFWIDSSLD